MSRFLDGPAGGVELVHRRAPILLRLVCGSAGWDVLDAADDEPADDETVHVYRKVPGTSGVAFVCARGRGGHGGRYESGDYEHLAEVDGETVRDTGAWREWARARAQTDPVVAQFAQFAPIAMDSPP